MKYRLLLTILLLPALSGTMLAQDHGVDQYNITWDSPSENSAGSMPCGGGDIGLNVWVEKGDLLIYLSRSGTFDENNTLLKLGRVRIRLNPDPLDGAKLIQQLLLEDGRVLIKGEKEGVSSTITVWVDVHRPVIHIDLQSNKPITATA